MGLGSRKPSGPADKLCINRPDTGPYLTQELCHNKSLANTEPSTQDIGAITAKVHFVRSADIEHPKLQRPLSGFGRELKNGRIGGAKRTFAASANEYAPRRSASRTFPPLARSLSMAVSYSEAAFEFTWIVLLDWLRGVNMACFPSAMNELQKR